MDTDPNPAHPATRLSAKPLGSLAKVEFDFRQITFRSPIIHETVL